LIVLKMRHLILVKHSQPQIVTSVPAAQWHLSDEGRRRNAVLAERLASYQPAAIVASREPKAMETGYTVASILETPFATAEGLHEHDRSNVGWSPTEDFEAAIERLFARPSELVFGSETADQARERFAVAVDAAIAAHPTGNLALVAHGTVIALYVAARTGVEPLPLWRRLGLPSFVVLSLPDMTLVEIVDQIV
jgi:broad specificity phosphatase PhoE